MSDAEKVALLRRRRAEAYANVRRLEQQVVADGSNVRVRGAASRREEYRREVERLAGLDADLAQCEDLIGRLEPKARGGKPRPTDLRSRLVTRSRLQPEVAKRRAIVAQHPKATASTLCARFQLEGVEFPPGWDDVTDWRNAYKLKEGQKFKYKGRIDKMISEDRRKRLR